MVFEKVQKLLAEALNIEDINTITRESNIVQDLERTALIWWNCLCLSKTISVSPYPTKLQTTL